MTETKQTIDLQAELSRRATEHAVPGVAVAVLHDGEEHYAFHGVTSIENPLDVDENTLFQSGSTGKTYTGTAIMRLVEQGKVDLSERVKTYVPELKLKDPDAEQNVTVLQLLNHTAGWSGDLLDWTGDGDDALARYVELMADLEQVTALGKAFSYNNASLSLAGRVIEMVTGQTFEQAMKELVFEPIGLENSYFFPNEVMTRRFAVGHTEKPDGKLEVARPWALPRGGNPAGGISTTVGDLIRWARFHMGDGTGADGKQVLSRATLEKMKQPTFDIHGGALGEGIGISWFLRDVDGVGIVGHGGNTVGQNCTFEMVPEKDLAVAILTNRGTKLDEELQRWILEAYVGVIVRDPEPVKLDDAKLAEYVGTYETIAVVCRVTASDGGLVLDTEVRPEVWAKISDGEMPKQEPFELGMLPGDGDGYVVTSGEAKGMRGYFARDASGAIEAVHIGGRLAERTKGN